jgi:hypothetical protein
MSNDDLLPVIWPSMSSPLAPATFNGESAKIEDFITAYERLCDGLGVYSDSERCLNILRYCAGSEYVLIAGLEGFVSHNWYGRLRLELMEVYGADEYRRLSLRKWARTWRIQSISSRTAFECMKNEFDAIVDPLLYRDSISFLEVDELFYAGLSPSFRRLLEDHDISKTVEGARSTWRYDEICTTAQAALSPGMSLRSLLEDQNMSFEDVKPHILAVVQLYCEGYDDETVRESLFNDALAERELQARAIAMLASHLLMQHQADHLRTEFVSCQDLNNAPLESLPPKGPGPATHVVLSAVSVSSSLYPKSTDQEEISQCRQKHDPLLRRCDSEDVTTVVATERVEVISLASDLPSKPSYSARASLHDRQEHAVDYRLEGILDHGRSLTHLFAMPRADNIDESLANDSLTTLFHASIFASDVQNNILNEPGLSVPPWGAVGIDLQVCELVESCRQQLPAHTATEEVGLLVMQPSTWFLSVYIDIGFNLAFAVLPLSDPSSRPILTLQLDPEDNKKWWSGPPVIITPKDSMATAHTTFSLWQFLSKNLLLLSPHVSTLQPHLALFDSAQPPPSFRHVAGPISRLQCGRRCAPTSRSSTYTQRRTRRRLLAIGYTRARYLVRPSRYIGRHIQSGLLVHI